MLLLLVMLAIAAFAWDVIWDKAVQPIVSLSQDLMTSGSLDVSIPGFFPVVTNIGALLLASWVLGSGIGFLWNRFIRKQKSATPREEEPVTKLTPEQVVQHVAFVQQLQALGAQFSLAIQQSQSGYSLQGVFTQACNDPEVRVKIESSPLLAQTTRLLQHDIEVLSGNVSRYRPQVDALDSSLTDGQMQELCNTTRDLFLEYKRLLGEVLHLLMELRGTLSIYAPPWSDRIEHGPHEGYEEIGRLLRDLRPKAPRNLQDLLPDKVQIGSFTSEFVQPHKGLR